MPLSSELAQFQDDRLGALSIDYVRTSRQAPAGMVVLMPSALTHSRPDRSKIVFNRSSWVDQWPDMQIVSFADPAMKMDNSLDGAWFIHPDFDILKTISEIAEEIAQESGLESDKVVFYGSSLGGFGAIGAAAHFQGSRAIAEIPQIDFGNWYSGAQRAVEEAITNLPISEYRKQRPEQISLIDRLEYAGYIPPFKILTNPTEQQYFDQQAFYSWARMSSLPKGEPLEFYMTTQNQGHNHFGMHDIVPHVNP